MAINKKLIHFKNYSDFNSKKLSANEANTTYTVGVGGVTYLGTPDVLYQSICWIRDTKQMWTHGTLYDCNGGDGASVYHLNESLSASGTLSQEAYDGVMSADIVTVAGSIADKVDNGDGSATLIVHSSSGNVAITITLQIASDKTYTYTSEFFTIPSEQVNADWNATSGKAQILNKPTIPSAVTESTVSGWGFTKNTGTYSKPNSGIPMDDLDTYVQNILDKAATKGEYAGIDDIVQLRGFESSLGGCVYALPDEANGAEDDIVATKNSLKTINGESIVGSGDINMPYYESGGYTYVQKGISDDDLIYALPTSAGGVEDDVLVTAKTLKTINGQSLMGNGDITISGGGGSSAYSEVSHGTSDTTFALTPNTFHIWDEVSSLTLTLGAETSGIANEYLFQFTSGSTATTLSLPDDIKWTGGDAPTIEANKIYQVSILKGLGSVMEWENAKVLINNLCTYDGDQTVTFQYPVASDVRVYVGSSIDMSIEVPFSAGETSVTFSGMPDPGSSIVTISPTQDGTYNYIF